MGLRTTGWTNRTLKFKDGRTMGGWREKDGGKTSVGVGKYAPAGAEGDIAVPARIKTTDNITIMGAFPVESEETVARYFDKMLKTRIEFYDDILDPETGRGAGSRIYRGVLSEVSPATVKGGDGTSTDVAEFELVLVMDGIVG